MAAFDLLTRQGKVLYIGCSNFSGKEIAAANKAAKAGGGTVFISNQPPYNMLQRDAEQELFPACKKLGVGNIVYSPLAHGVLSGKYKSLDGITEGRLAHWQPEHNFLTEENLAKVEQLGALAAQFGMTSAQLALRWCLRRPEVAAVIVGASKPGQLDENTAAGDLALSAEQLQAIEAVIASA
jgi:aryl-alcohol dehydrogenase-like predicted oxidoreductase